MQDTLFSLEETMGIEWYKFKNSSWGKLHAVLPLAELSDLLPTKNTNKGPQPYFDNVGMFALMFLKHELGVSDEKLIEHINHNVSFQLFCGMRLGHLEQIRDTGIVSRIRGYLSQQIDFERFQSIMVGHWKEDLSHQHFLKMDATCFESYIRYPSDVKLLWECCEWVYDKQLFLLRKTLGFRLGKEKERFDTQKRKYLSYSKQKRKGYKKTRRRIKSLLNLLDKGISALQDLLNSHLRGSLKIHFYSCLKTIKKVYVQQKYLYDHKGAKIQDRIVSLYKDYIRPIKRGKENKPTEFGAKVHMLQIDGINIVEKLSFKAFNECKRLKMSVFKHKQMFGECHQLSADGIYPTNENRHFCTAQSIFTGFVAKGRKPEKSIRELKAELNKDRATRLEGSFGNEKNHYGLGKVKARNEQTEIAWIYFGVFTANAVLIAKRKAKKKLEEQSPPRRKQAA